MGVKFEVGSVWPVAAHLRKQSDQNTESARVLHGNILSNEMAVLIMVLLERA